MGIQGSSATRASGIGAEDASTNPFVWDAAGAPARWTRFAPLLASGVLLSLYVATLTPSVAGGDSGELAAAALTGGAPHPSGYPLFALLARLFGALPLGHTPIWRVNLLSAVSTAAAAGCVCAFIQAWTRSAAAGLTAAALFGTSPVVWSNATSTEVFGLNALCVALALYLWSRAERTRGLFDVCALLLGCGLGMSNHHSFVFVGVPLALRSLWIAAGSLGPRGVGLAVACGLVGLLPYAYLMSPSVSKAAVSWGDETTFNGLVAHILRQTYGTFSMGRPTEDQVFVTRGTFFPTLWRMWGDAWPRLLWVGPALALLGGFTGLRGRSTRTMTVVLLSVLLLYGLTFSSLSNLSTSRPLYLSILGRFCIESDLLVATAAGLGLAAVLKLLGGPPRGTRSWLRFSPLIGLAVFAVGVAAHAQQGNGRNNTVLRDFVTAALASVPPRAIVLTGGDEITNASFYLHEVEHLRPDIIHFGLTYLGAPWYTEREARRHPDLYVPQGGYGPYGWKIKRLLDGNPGRPVIVIGHLDDWDQSWEKGYKLVFVGLVSSLVRAKDFPSYEEWVEKDRAAIGSYDVVPALRAPEESWENAIGQRVLGTQVGRAHLALVYSTERQGAPGPAQYARLLLEDVVAKTGGDSKLEIAPWPGCRRLDVGPAVWKDLGILYEILSHTDRRVTPRIAMAYEKFLNRADANDPDLPAALKYLQESRPIPVVPNERPLGVDTTVSAPPN
ncbi:MAG: DUF2723 domain-containing protein [Polyangiaceae bacterium]|jgi:hypothetical protein